MKFRDIYNRRRELEKMKNKRNRRDREMKFRILDESTVKYLIDFLDDIQLQAAEVDDRVLLKFCQDMISQLINADEVFDNDENIKRYKFKDDSFSEDYLFKIYDYLTQIKNYTDSPQDAGRKKRKKQKKEDKKVNVVNIDSSMSLKEIEQFLIEDDSLSNYEKFELYYDERERIKPKEKGLTYNQLLKQSGIKPPKK
tara:strand:+ start:400 stop:990 length:591 start_codon:yes stop_codon:yes gene_type:complete